MDAKVSWPVRSARRGRPQQSLTTGILRDEDEEEVFHL